MDGDGDLDVLSASIYDQKIAWYEQVTTPVLPFFEDWESGAFAGCWDVIEGDEGRIRITSGNGPYGGFDTQGFFLTETGLDIGDEPANVDFYEDESGFVQGDGCGVVMLKRYSDAVRDGDRIYSVIHGIASNNDGGSTGPMAPVLEGQVEVVQRHFPCPFRYRPPRFRPFLA